MHLERAASCFTEGDARLFKQLYRGHGFEDSSTLREYIEMAGDAFDRWYDEFPKKWTKYNSRRKIYTMLRKLSNTVDNGVDPGVWERVLPSLHTRLNALRDVERGSAELEASAEADAVADAEAEDEDAEDEDDAEAEEEAEEGAEDEAKEDEAEEDEAEEDEDVYSNVVDDDPSFHEIRRLQQIVHQLYAEVDRLNALLNSRADAVAKFLDKQFVRLDGTSSGVGELMLAFHSL